MILIIGGTGTYFLEVERWLGACERRELDTPFGAAGAVLFPRRYGGKLALTSRHGWGRLEVSPPFVNSRANLWAAHQLGTTHILGWNGVGAINPLLQVHDRVVLDQVMDWTKTRGSAAETAGIAATPRQSLGSEPPLFDPALCAALFRTAQQRHARSFPVGVYACAEGPRLETAAEIAAFARQGAEVVGMTLVPEIFLAREYGIPWGALAYVTNYATGVEPSAGAPRFFGVEVAERCLETVLAVAEELLA